jgi:hypothetical protein
MVLLGSIIRRAEEYRDAQNRSSRQPICGCRRQGHLAGERQAIGRLRVSIHPGCFIRVVLAVGRRGEGTFADCRRCITWGKAGQGQFNIWQGMAVEGDESFARGWAAELETCAGKGERDREVSGSERSWSLGTSCGYN